MSSMDDEFGVKYSIAIGYLIFVMKMYAVFYYGYDLKEFIICRSSLYHVTLRWFSSPQLAKTAPHTQIVVI